MASAADASRMATNSSVLHLPITVFEGRTLRSRLVNAPASSAATSPLKRTSDSRRPEVAISSTLTMPPSDPGVRGKALAQPLGDRARQFRRHVTVKTYLRQPEARGGYQQQADVALFQAPNVSLDLAAGQQLRNAVDGGGRFQLADPAVQHANFRHELRHMGPVLFPHLLHTVPDRIRRRQQQLANGFSRRLLRQFPQTTESAAHSGFAIAVGLRQRFHHLLESAGGGRQLLANIVQVLSRLGPVVAQQRPQRGAGFAQRLGGGG